MIQFGPWKVNKPTSATRIQVALVIGAFSAILFFLLHPHSETRASDFGQVWFGARALFHHRNPYLLVGPGLEYSAPWKLLYPATAMIVAAPLAILPQFPATILFVFVSCTLLAYSLTSENWNRLVLLMTPPFFYAAIAAQWSPLMTAAFTLPGVALILAAKPTLGAAISLAASGRVLKYAVIGGVALLLVSFAVMPGWLWQWASVLKTGTSHMGSPIMRFGGIAVLAVALRWHRPEARLLLAMALIPQTGTWYELVPLFLIPSTLNECAILAITISCGWLTQNFTITAQTEAAINSQVQSVMLATAYLPCAIMILRRPERAASGPTLYRAASPSR